MIHLHPLTESEFWALWDALDQPTAEEIEEVEEHNPELASVLRQLLAVCP